MKISKELFKLDSSPRILSSKLTCILKLLTQLTISTLKIKVSLMVITPSLNSWLNLLPRAKKSKPIKESSKDFSTSVTESKRTLAWLNLWKEMPKKQEQLTLKNLAIKLEDKLRALLAH